VSSHNLDFKVLAIVITESEENVNRKGLTKLEYFNDIKFKVFTAVDYDEFRFLRCYVLWLL
jgi:hypothetical protein